MNDLEKSYYHHLGTDRHNYSYLSLNQSFYPDLALLKHPADCFLIFEYLD